jgi:hypothetical protein
MKHMEPSRWIVVVKVFEGIAMPREQFTPRLRFVHQSSYNRLVDLALFDFDGTITSAGTWTAFVWRTATLPRKAIGAIALLPVVVAYQLKLIGGATARPIVAMVAFTGRSESGSLDVYLQPWCAAIGLRDDLCIRGFA